MKEILIHSLAAVNRVLSDFKRDLGFFLAARDLDRQV
jgi:hypothetical protein